jgi:hypothetical protein
MAPQSASTLSRMPVSITCSVCSVRLTIPDSLYERMVRGRVVTIGCKRCGADNVLDGTQPQAAQASPKVTEPAQPSQRPSVIEVDLDEPPTLVYESRPPMPGSSEPQLSQATPAMEKQREDES